jgi:hypothetical protein
LRHGLTISAFELTKVYLRRDIRRFGCIRRTRAGRRLNELHGQVAQASEISDARLAEPVSQSNHDSMSEALFSSI